jgi:hypothetical protein
MRSVTAALRAAFAALLVVAAAACTTGPGATSTPGADREAGTPRAATSEPEDATPAPDAETPVASVSIEGLIEELDVCSLASKSEIEEIMGTEVEEGEGENREAGISVASAQCQWDGADPTRGITFLTVHIAEFNQDVWDLDVDDEGTEDVPGVGDMAMRTEIRPGIDPGGNLIVKAGDLMLTIVLYNGDAEYDVVAPQQEEIANLVISRLP